MIWLQQQYAYFEKHLYKAQVFASDRFANQELKMNLNVDNSHRQYIIGSLTAPDAQVLELLRCMHYLQMKEKEVFLFSPYFGYQRQDDDSYGLAWACDMLNRGCVDQVTTVQIHNSLAPELQHVQQLQVISMNYFFHDELFGYFNQNYSVVFPDQSAYNSFHRDLKTHASGLGWFVKTRTGAGVLLEAFEGKVGKKVCLVDDILDSGQTLVQACVRLRAMGVDDIVVFVAHAFFHGEVWHDLWRLGVKKIYCLDSVAQLNSIDYPCLQVIPIFSKITIEKLFHFKV